MKFSDFGNKLCGESGILTLMDDLGKPLPAGVKPYRLGGGNPATIEEVSAMYRREMEAVMARGEFDSLIGCYDSPQGRMSFIGAVADCLSKKYGWKISPKNVCITNGSQSACFYLFNLLSGTFTSKDGQKTKKKVLFPLAPEYIGYADQGIEPDTFVSLPSTVETFADHTFKYHVDLPAVDDFLSRRSDIGAIAVSRPTNPSGNVLTDSEIQHLSDLSKKYSIPLIIDNAYGLPWPDIIFTDDASPYWDENVILSMSMSKIGLPSLRTGIIIAREEIVTALSNLNAIAALASGSVGQALAEPLIKNGELIETARKVVRPFYEKKSREAQGWIHKYFAGTNYAVHKSEGSIFLWLFMGDLKMPTLEFYSVLKNRGVVVVPGEYFFFGDEGTGSLKKHPHYDKCLRLNYAGPADEVEGGLKIIAEEYKKHGGN